MNPVNFLHKSRFQMSRMISPLLSIFLVFMMAGCAMSGAGTSRAPVTEREFKCFGSGMDRKTCIGDASRLCSMGFELFEKDAVGEDGETRTGLYFRCRP